MNAIPRLDPAWEVRNPGTLEGPCEIRGHPARLRLDRSNGINVDLTVRFEERGGDALPPEASADALLIHGTEFPVARVNAPDGAIALRGNLPLHAASHLFEPPADEAQERAAAPTAPATTFDARIEEYRAAKRKLAGQRDALRQARRRKRVLETELQELVEDAADLEAAIPVAESGLAALRQQLQEAFDAEEA